MTTYSTGFDSYTVGSTPSDWTPRWVTASTTWAVRSKSAVEGGQTLEYTGTASAHHLLTWDALDADANRDNAEILARVRTSAGSTEPLRLTIRGSGAAASETGYSFQYNPSSLIFQLQKYVAGALTNLGTSQSFTTAANVWYYVRFRVNGTTLSAKFWKDGDAEPSSWGFTATDSSITAAGWIGVGNQDSTGTRDVDFFSVGTNGDTAPLATSSATETRISQAVAEAALATVAEGRISQVVVEVGFSAPIAGVISQMVVEVAFSSASAVTQQPRMIVIM
jgi:hypothetical protein